MLVNSNFFSLILLQTVFLLKYISAFLTLAHFKVKYEETRVTFADWGELKPTTTFGQLPMLTWDGLELAQSGTIVRYLLKSLGDVH